MSTCFVVVMFFFPFTVWYLIMARSSLALLAVCSLARWSTAGVTHQMRQTTQQKCNVKRTQQQGQQKWRLKGRHLQQRRHWQVTLKKLSPNSNCNALPVPIVIKKTKQKQTFQVHDLNSITHSHMKPDKLQIRTEHCGIQTDVERHNWALCCNLLVSWLQ